MKREWMRVLVCVCASSLLLYRCRSVVVCESKQAAQIYRHFLPFLTSNRQREREEKFPLGLLATHADIERARAFIVCVCVCREKYRASKQAMFAFDFPFSSRLPVCDKARTREWERERKNRWKRKNVVTVVCVRWRLKKIGWTFLSKKTTNFDVKTG